MNSQLEPIVGNWYLPLFKGQQFRVVAVNDAEGLIETQHFDGDLEEIELDAWNDLEIEPAEPPEDWTGPIDDVERDDLGYTDDCMEREDWCAPLDALHRELVRIVVENSGEEQDVGGEEFIEQVAGADDHW